MEKVLDDISDFFKDMELPDIGGIDGSTIQIILVVLVGLWLLMKVKKLFFLFMFIMAFYYLMQSQ